MNEKREITDPEEILAALKALAVEHQANRTPEQAIFEEMADYYGDLFYVTLKRLLPEFAADGWSLVERSQSANGTCGAEFWRTDLLEAARAGRKP